MNDFVQVRENEICVTEGSLDTFGLQSGQRLNVSFDIVKTAGGYDVSRRPIEATSGSVMSLREEQKPVWTFKSVAVDMGWAVLACIGFTVVVVFLQTLGDVTPGKSKRKDKTWPDSATGEFVDDYADGKEGIK